MKKKLIASVVLFNSLLLLVGCHEHKKPMPSCSENYQSGGKLGGKFSSENYKKCHKN